MPQSSRLRTVRRSAQPLGTSEQSGAGKQPEPDFKQLHDQVKDSSDKNRHFFFVYFALMVYVQATVFSTTDKMLLLSFEGLTLPLIDLMFPLLGFYVVIPFFVLALHFNLLNNLESHHYKLMQWRYAFAGGQVPRSRINAFLFDFAVLEQGSVLKRLLRIISAVLYLYLGPLTLALVLWRMTDYQDPWLTGWHTFAFLFNCWLVARTRRSFRANAAAKPENAALGVEVSKRDAVDASASVSAGGALSDATASGGRWLRWGYRVMAALGIGLVLAEAGLGIAVAALPSKHFLEFFSSSGSFFDLADLSREKPVLKLVLPLIDIDPNDTVYEVNETKLKTLAALARQSDWVKWFYDSGYGLDLRGRSLRGAQLSEQRLPSALMQDTQLQEANFERAQLQGADFGDAQLQGAGFSNAQLQKAIFRDAQLQGADFSYVRLQGAHFGEARLQGAKFFRAQLRGANFFGARLQGASFEDAPLQGASFMDAQLQGAHFRYARLQAVSFTRADFTGANLDHAQLQGAIGIRSNIPVLGEGPDSTSLKSADWDQLKKLANTIPNQSRKSVYLLQINRAKEAKPLRIEDLPKANHLVVPERWANYFCQTDPPPGQPRVDGVDGARAILRGEPIFPYMPIYPTTTEFAHLLCTKSECQPLRNQLLEQGALTCKKP